MPHSVTVRNSHSIRRRTVEMINVGAGIYLETQMGAGHAESFFKVIR